MGVPGSGSIGGFGTGNVQTYPTDLINSLWPYFNLSQQMPYQYASLAQQAAANEADARARIQAAQIGAGATTQAAGINAQASLDAALMGAKAQLQGLQAQIQRDVQLAAGGDRNANNRLQANLQQTAQITNQANRLELAKMASSGGLRDSLAARMAIRGVGQMPGFGSGLLAGQIQEITAPEVKFSDYGAAPTVNMSLPSGGNYAQAGGGGGYTGGGYGGGGGGGGGFTMPPAPDFSTIFDSIFKMPPAAGPVPAPAATYPNPALTFTPGMAAPPPIAGAPAGADPLWGYNVTLGSGATLADLNKFLYPTPHVQSNLPMVAHGGAIPPGQSFIAGDPQKKGKPNPEVVTPIPGVGTFVTPLAGKYAHGTGEWGERKPEVNLGGEDGERKPEPVVPGAGSSLTGLWNDPRYYSSSYSATPHFTPKPSAPAWEPPAPPPPPPPPPDEPPAPPPDVPTGDTGTTATLPDGTVITSGGANTSPTAAASLPSWQALISGNPGTPNWNLGKWDVPEWGVSGIPNPYQGASTFLALPGSQQQEIADLWGQATGNVLDWNTIMEMVNAANPGYRTGRSMRY